ncbi:hypothetical protein CHS0354_022315 [Potamilus streckersoni]|uniref:Serine/threonine-protein kinase ULK3 n=1 Tax=Potamilus streckersoni TaxID=2493646 RepID=A0AAE0TH18_9BIVA|nr:hypothetical protein CHS0354_022315 [Potamilus streckersoni]
MSRPSTCIPNSSSSSKPSGGLSIVPKLREFVFTEKLGSGSYATVYKAYRKGGLREVVAIKCVLKSTLTKASTENLLTEIGLLKKLNHDNIVELKDFQWDDTYIYLIMEYCSGGDLSQFIRSKRKLPEHAVRRFLRQLVSALQYLREHNVAHMDLKPQNILITSPTHPVLKIADFGFAKHLFQGDELHALRGSPLYMAPEIICKGQYDARVDLWSTGVILYECLFGRAPFASRSFKELEEKIRDPGPVELPFGVEISDNCRDFLLRLLQRDPDKRITFDDFFNHPFLDLRHAPSSNCLPEAVKLVQEAVSRDQAGQHQKAVKLYCSAIEFFIPAIKYEKNPVKKDALRTKVKEYMDRAEELKQSLKPHKDTEGTLQRAQSRDSKQELMDLFQDSAEMVAALKLMQAAEMEEEKEDYESADRHYELGLEVIIKALQDEPKGRKKDLLGDCVHKWLSKAEEIKNYLAVKKLKTSEPSEASQQDEDTYRSIFSTIGAGMKALK